ncbi:MAG: RNA-binding domain-containing protein [Saccharofermentanales bacterium]
MKDILLCGESRTVEYKQEYTKTLLKTVSAFANYFDGCIVIGVSDKGTVTGLQNPDETRLNLENSINDQIEPKPFYEITTEIIKDRTVLILKVYKGEHTPYTFNHKAYRRMDTATVQTDKYAYEELVLQGRNLSFEELASDDQKLAFNLLSDRLKKSIKINDWNEDLLITLGLKRSGRFNNAAALLSDTNPLRQSDVQLIAYSGTSVLDIKDRQLLSDISILQQYDSCMDFYRKHINMGEIIDGAYRKTVEEIPLVAYREAVANAIIHRDYSKNADIRIEFFEDRVEVVSPGRLPIGISEEEYYEGRISIPRNDILAEIFLRLGIIERLATGIRRIKEFYRDYSVKPVFKVTDNAILVILPKVSAIDDSNENREEGFTSKLTEKELLIYNSISKKGFMTRSEIEKTVGLKKSHTIDLINKLRDKDLIAQIDRGRITKYMIK